VSASGGQGAALNLLGVPPQIRVILLRHRQQTRIGWILERVDLHLGKAHIFATLEPLAEALRHTRSSCGSVVCLAKVERST
jgi:hypothetical protein